MILREYVEVSEADGLIFTTNESGYLQNRAATTSGRRPRVVAARFWR